MIELRTLGTLDVRDPAAGTLAAVMAQPKRCALLLYLALARPHGPQRRDTLIGLFWPEAADARARRSLNQAVYVLRQALGDDALITSGDSLALDPARFRCDALDLESALDRGDLETAERQGRSLLPGFFLADCLEFERWLEDERARLRDRVVAAAGSAADRVTGERPDVAARWLRVGADWSPYDESLLRRLLEALAAAGDRTGALREYEAFARRAAADLELEPGPETRALAERLRAENGRAPETISPAARAIVAAPATTIRARDQQPSAILEPDQHHSGTEPRNIGPAIGEAVPTPGSLAAPPRRRRAPFAIGAAAAAALLLALLVMTAPGGAARDEAAADETLHDRRVVVLPLENRVGDPALDPLGPMAADWIIQGLNETGVLQVVPYTSALRRLETGGLAADVATETGARYLVEGAFLRHEDRLLVQARVVDGADGRVLRSLELDAGPLDDPVAVVQQVRSRVTGAVLTLLDPRMADWTDAASQPPSFEAYRIYVDAMDLFFERDDRAAARRFREAAALDTGFTAPLLWAVQAQINGGLWDDARRLTDSLMVRRDRLAPWDRAMLDFHHAALAPDPEAEYQAARRLTELAPTSEWRLKHAAAALYTRRVNEAARVFASIDPDRGWIRSWPAYWWTFLGARHRAGDFEGELRDLERMRARYPEAGAFIEARARIGLGEGAAVVAELRAGLDTLAERVRLTWVWSTVLEVRKHGPAAARIAADSLLARTLDLAARPPQSPGMLARLLFLAARDDEAKPLFQTLHEDMPENWEPLGYLGMIAARTGDRDEATRWERAIAALQVTAGAGEETVWRAGIAAHLGDLDRAVELMHEARRQGLFWHDDLYLLPHLAPLRGYPAFEALMRTVDAP